MKVLFKTVGYRDNLNTNELADYQCNMTLHGFRSLFGKSVIDCPKQPFMYPGFHNYLGLYGKGFSYCDTLGEVDVNREGSTNMRKACQGYFNIIVLAVHHSVHNNPQPLYSILDILRNHHVKSKVVVIDGNDERNTYNCVFDYDLDLYMFKREIPDSMTDERIHPISFAIPAEKVLNKVPEKTQIFANILPADHTHPNRATHVYNSEADYYKDYQDSWFGLISIKGGATSMRTYEVLANGCIPIFTDLENVAKRTAVDLPKEKLLQVKEYSELEFKKKCFDKNEITDDSILFNPAEWTHNKRLAESQFFLDFTRKNLTTVALAEKVLATIGI